MAEGNESSLLALKYDCLYKIFHYIQIENLVQLHGKVCMLFDELILARLRNLKCYEISMRHTPNFTAEQLKLIGFYISSLHLSVGFSISKGKVLNILRPLCEGGAESGALQMLKFNYVSWTHQYTDCLKKVAPQLIHLDISHSEVSTDDQLVGLLQQCTKLSTLVMRGLYEIDEHCLTSGLFKHLQLLELDSSVMQHWKMNFTELTKIYPNLEIFIYDNILGKIRKYSCEENVEIPCLESCRFLTRNLLQSSNAR